MHGRDAIYTYGHSPGVVAVHARRSAAREAGFLLPYLRPGMRLLDAGCGPGSITIGLAETVAPSEVAGIDLAPAVLGDARALAAGRGAGNARFAAADVAQLPFPDASFDAVFAHTLLEHVADGVAVLRELRRVLRPGGAIGVRDSDWASGVFAPDDVAVAEAMELYERVWRQNGGHPRCGRYLRGLLAEAGFEEVRTSASFRWDGSAEESRAFGELLAHRLALPAFAGPILANGWRGRQRLDEIVAACLAWSRRPDAFAAMVMAEAIGVKPSIA
jgi:ubiquinone/menaquinone biosynthesis C-methylase UbiE